MKFNSLEVTRLQPVEVDALLAALDTLGLAWWTKDREGRYLRLNAAGHALLGLAPGDALGRTDAELLSSTTASLLRALEASALRGGGLQALDQPADFNGQRRQLACAALAMPTTESANDAANEAVSEADSGAAVLGAWLDVTELRHREAELRSVLTQLEVQQDQQRQLRAEIDGRAALTPMRLVRREQFEDQLSREIDLSLREHREFAVVYIAIDPLDPPPADAAGAQSARERIVSAFDGLLRTNTRAMDAPSRLDGERFALLLSGVGLATAHARMEGLRRQCATQLIAHNSSVLRFTVSMGVASYPHTSQTQTGLQRAADTALDQAQRRGGNHVALASIAFGGPPSVM